MPSMFRITDFSALVNELEMPLNIPASRLLTETNLLDYRAVLKDPDTQLVKSALGVVENVLDTIGRGLRDIDTVREFVVENQRKMESLQASFRALVAPIRRFPTELLQEIFMHAREWDQGRLITPPVASQVCRYWRRAALSTPRLWAKIVRFVDVNCAELWTQGSAECPLWLVVQSKRRSHSSVQTMAELARAIVHNAHRLELLAFKVPHLKLEGILDAWKAPDSVPASFPLLRTFKAEVTPPGGGDRESHQKMCQLICTKAPRLEKVDCAGITFADDTPMKWKAIKYFSGDLPLPLLASCLSFSEGIEILETGEYTVTEEPSTLYSISLDIIAVCPPLSHLTSLQLNGTNIPSKPEFFPALPALRHLIYIAPAQVLESDPFLLFLARWGPQLLYLNLPSSELASFVLACLDLAPKLEALGIRESALFGASERPLHLSHLEIGVWDIDEDEVDSICDRLNPTRLSTLTIIGDGSIESVIDEIDYLRLRAGILEISNVHYMEQRWRLGRFNTPYFMQKGGMFNGGVPFEELEGHPDFGSDLGF